MVLDGCGDILELTPGSGAFSVAVDDGSSDGSATASGDDWLLAWVVWGKQRLFTTIVYFILFHRTVTTKDSSHIPSQYTQDEPMKIFLFCLSSQHHPDTPIFGVTHSLI